MSLRLLAAEYSCNLLNPEGRDGAHGSIRNKLTWLCKVTQTSRVCVLRGSALARFACDIVSGAGVLLEDLWKAHFCAAAATQISPSALSRRKLPVLWQCGRKSGTKGLGTARVAVSGVDSVGP